jgi:hypothetical protein
LIGVKRTKSFWTYAGGATNFAGLTAANTFDIDIVNAWNLRLGFTGTPSPSQLVMTCLAACVVMDSHSTGAAVDTPSPAKSSSPEFSSLLPRDKQFELVSDVIMALLRACPEGIDEGGQGESAADASVAAPIIVRAIAARLALKACRIDMVQCLGGLY